MNIVLPRGLVIAGMTAQFTSAQQRDNFRMLNDSLKHIEIIPYDELSRRLLNTVTSIEALEGTTAPKPRTQKGRKP